MKMLEIVLVTLAAAAAGGFIGSFGFWLITKIEDFWRRPRISLEFGEGYPFRSEAHYSDGERGEFVRVRVKNNGRGMAKRCKCYVHKITLDSGGRTTRLPSDELMLTSWVPREANVKIQNIPPRLDFLADIASTSKSGTGYKVAPVFGVQIKNVVDIFQHVGEFELELIVIGDNFSPAKRAIKFRFDDRNSPALIPVL
jgi:hypothetical protein